MTEKVLLEKNLPNGMRVTFYDESKKMAADRWLVKIRCEALLMPGADLVDMLTDTELRREFMARYGDGVRHVMVKARNFIDARDKDVIREELLHQLRDNAFAYLGGQRFPRGLLEKKVADFQRERELAQKMSMLPPGQEEEDGPADFSFCFRD